MRNKTKQKDQKKAKNCKVGALGEFIAVKYLKGQGFTIIKRNFRKVFGEIDIVAKKEGKLHFIEVKSVSYEIFSRKGVFVSHETTNGDWRPEENVTESKRRKIAKTIQIFLAERKVGDSIEWQFDVSTVYLDFSRRIGRVHMLWNIIL